MTPAGANNNNNNNFTKISSDSSHHACCWSLGVCCVCVYVCVVVITDTRIVIRCAHFQGNFSNKRKTKPIFTDKWSRRGSGGCVAFIRYLAFAYCPSVWLWRLENGLICGIICLLSALPKEYPCHCFLPPSLLASTNSDASVSVDKRLWGTVKAATECRHGVAWPLISF